MIGLQAKLSYKCELKIFAMVLTNRLLPVMSTLVHADQCGFMPGCRTRHGIRCLNSAVAGRVQLQGSLALLLIDFEKVFDTVD